MADRQRDASSPLAPTHGDTPPTMDAITDQLAAASLNQQATDGVCDECRFRCRGCVDEEDQKFYCFACWAAYQQRNWHVIGAKSELFKTLSSDLPLFTFCDYDGPFHPRFGTQRLSLLSIDADGAAECAELRRTGELNGRAVLGFDTESKPCFTRGSHNPICLIQLASPSLAVLFRLRSPAPLPTALASLLEDDNVTLVGQDIHKEVLELGRDHGLKQRKRPKESIIELAAATRAMGCLCAGVAGYAASLVGIRLHKTKKLQMSNWEAPQLSEPQQRYAATDAWVCWYALAALESQHVMQECRASRPAFFLDEIAALNSRALPTLAPMSAVAAETGLLGNGTEAAYEVPACQVVPQVSVGPPGLAPKSEVAAEAGLLGDFTGAAYEVPACQVVPQVSVGPPGSKRGKRRGNCRFFAVGTCRNGDACPYSHAASKMHA